MLWHLFRALTEGAPDGLVRELGRKVKKVLAAIDRTVEGFFHEALQISRQQVSVQVKARLVHPDAVPGGHAAWREVTASAAPCWERQITPEVL